MSARVGGLADLRGLLGQDDADVQAEEPVHPAHPLAVPFGQVVVGGDDVNALALEGVQIGRQGGDQGLALAGLHLGDVAEVQRSTAHQLDVEVALTESALGGLAHDGERLDQQVVGRLTVRDALLESRGLLAQLVVGHRDVRVFHIVDVVGDRAQTLECLRLADPEQSAKNHVFHPRSNRAAPHSGRRTSGQRLTQPEFYRVPRSTGLGVGPSGDHGRRTARGTGVTVPGGGRSRSHRRPARRVSAVRSAAATRSRSPCAGRRPRPGGCRHR